MFILFNYLHLIRNFQEIMEIPSSSSSSSSNYDVFLSFRGVDTRKNFTDHLYTALKREGIHTFRDKDELEAGGSIGPELRKAIEGSKISIVVFSINYAWSRSCLDELAHIMKCRKELGQKVVPIFYNVQPNVVQHQTDSFRDAFAAHELRYKDDLGRWRAALGEAADLTGFDVENHGDGYESTIIKDIVKVICDKLNRKRLSVPTNLVGLDSRLDQVMSLLVIDNLNEIRMVGICGMGGIGKTTTAKQVYNSIFQNFEGSCFLTHIPEKPDSEDMVRKQNQLVSQILKRKCEDIYDVHRGFEVIKESLGNKRILIVVDDVSEIEQLKYILGNYTWLSCGSRIIITTRTLDLEKPSRGYHQYLVEVLDEGESLQLFSLHCFEECDPPKEYMKLAKSVIGYAGGIPLALKVLGSTLSGQSADEWERKLEKLKAIPDRKIQDVLKTSYDCLDDMEKSLFLDIACFFVDFEKDVYNFFDYFPFNRKDFVISILDDAPHFFAEDGINTLIKRCLIKVNSRNELVMHDLLLEMGRDIVRRECPADPGKCSRVWHHDVASNLLKDEKVMRKMKRLRLLRIDDPSGEFTGFFEHIFLSKQLRLVQWQCFPLESISSVLHLENLVALEMGRSKLKVWGEMKLPKLKFLYLTWSLELRETPNFDGLPNLEIIKLHCCFRLLKVHKSICRLTKLVELNLDDCISLCLLPKLPSSLITLQAHRCYSLITDLHLENLVALEMGSSKLKVLGEMKLPKLKFLDLSDSRELTETPNFDGLPNLEILKLSRCTNLLKVHESICRLTKLVELNLDFCTSLRLLPKLPSSLITLTAFSCHGLECFNSVNGIRNDSCTSLCLPPKLPSSLITLKADGCYSLITDLHLENLVVLEMQCSKLKVLGEMKLPKLKFLDLSDSRELTETPNFDGLPNLEILKLSLCRNLLKVHESICRLTKLVELNLDSCTSLCLPPKLPSSLITLKANGCYSLITDLHLENLVALEMGSSKLKVLGEMKLPKLKFLDLSDSRELTETPNFDGLPNLEILKLSLCRNLLKVHESICRLTKLVELNLNFCTSLRLLPKLPSSLITLTAYSCHVLECFNSVNGIRYDGFLAKEPTGVGGGEKIVQPRTRSAGTKILKLCVNNLSFSCFFNS